MLKHIRKLRLVGLPSDLIRDLVNARHAHGWSQHTLAAMVGLPQTHISGIETGKVTPRYNTLLDLVRILDYDLLLVPRPLVPAVQSLIRESAKAANPDPDEGDRPLYES